MGTLSPHWLRATSEAFLRILVIAAGIILLGLAMDRLRVIVLPLLAAIILATALMPFKQRLVRRGLHNTLATIIVVGGVIAILGAIGYAMTRGLSDEFRDLVVDVEEGLSQAVESVGEAFGLSKEQTDEAFDDILDGIRGNAGTIAGGLFSGVLVLFEILAGAILLVVLLFLIVKDAERMQRAVARRLNRQHRHDFLMLTTGLWTTLGRYFRGVAIVAFMDALFIGIGLVIIGIPFAIPLAVLTFFGAFIPIIGAVLAGLAAFLIALATEGVTAALIVGGLVLAVQQIEGNVLAPYIVGHQVSLHPGVIILAVATGGTLWGILGAFVAVPVTVIAITLVDFYTHSGQYRQRAAGAPRGGAAV